MFPYISHIDELRAHVQHLPEIRFMSRPDGTTIVCYLIADDKTFASPWARECRGITFDAAGKLICRPLHKFFNMGENAESLPASQRWDELSAITEKLDGSMLTPFLLGNDLRWKTKKSAESDVARMADAYARNHPQIEAFCREVIAQGCTPVFEFTAPEARVVVGYAHPQLTLLHVRAMETGAYRQLRDSSGQPTSYATHILAQYGIAIVEAYPTERWPALRAGLSTLRNREGYILSFGEHMLKVKGDWYRAAHKVVSVIRERDVASFVVNERLDDVLAVLREVGANLEAVQEVAHRVVQHIVSLQDNVEQLVASFASESPRVVAAQLENHPLRGMVLARHRGKDVDYLDFFRKYYLKGYSLTQLPTRSADIDFDG